MRYWYIDKTVGFKHEFQSNYVRSARIEYLLLQILSQIYPCIDYRYENKNKSFQYGVWPYNNIRGVKRRARKYNI